jgi:hypothetical protein
MEPELRQLAETRLQAAAAELNMKDPRQPYRDRLRQLREQHTDAFTRAIDHYETQVLPSLAEVADPLAVWLDYGSFLAQLTSTGRAWRIDGAGRASSLEGSVHTGDLVMFVPDDTSSEVLVMAEPESPSAAQNATMDLLVRRKLSL